MDQPDNQSSDSTLCLNEQQADENEMIQDKGKMDEQKEEAGKPDKSNASLPRKGRNYENFLKELAQNEAPEQKISHCLQYMEQALSQGGTPSFKNFWDARKLCLNLFKEKSLSFAVRSHLWNKYVELSKEAHRLKEVLDEQSSFAAEQIDLAIKALEDDIEKHGKSDLSSTEGIFESPPKQIESKIDKYNEIQGELNLLNAFAARINALRKELIKTEMRIRYKNKFFQRLSTTGDKIFPRRKELIKTISCEFLDDVDRFIEENFSASKFKQPLYFLREEIKALQGVAKILTLNTQAFNQTRMKLSECWDKIKKIEKEKKKDKAKLKAAFKENAEKVDEKIKELENQYKDKAIDQPQTTTAIQEISQYMRQFQLSREDLKQFRDRLNNIRSDITNKMAAAEQERLKREREHEQDVKQKAVKIISELQSLTVEVKNRPADEIDSEAKRLAEEIANLKPAKSERQSFDQQLQLLNDRISEEKIRNLPQNEQEAYEQLHILLKESKKRRSEIKEKLESYRKASGVSGLDMEQALKQRELLEHEKERLEKVDEEIDQIKRKIRELQE